MKEWKACLQVGKRVKQVWNMREGLGLGASRRSWMSFPKRVEIVFMDSDWMRKEGVRDLAELNMRKFSRSAGIVSIATSPAFIHQQRALEFVKQIVL